MVESWVWRQPGRWRAGHEVDIVVVAAGAWIGRLLPCLGRRLIPSRQIVAYFDLPDDQRAAWQRGR